MLFNQWIERLPAMYCNSTCKNIQIAVEANDTQVIFENGNVKSLHNYGIRMLLPAPASKRLAETSVDIFDLSIRQKYAR